MLHPVFAPGRVAVITGAASGIGCAAARHFVALGMQVCMADVHGERLARAAGEVAAAAPGGADAVMHRVADVADFDAMCALEDGVRTRFGECALLMNNAVTRTGGDVLGRHQDWRAALDVNVCGVLNGIQAFVPAMVAQGTPCAVVNSGSKQGITMPPGNSAYNVTKAALKVATEMLAHELRCIEGCQVNAHLLIPGWTTTGDREHRPGAWLPEQVVTKLVDAIEAGDFYILCPDNEVTTEMDHKRILWAAGDILNNRPPLSRWHEEHAQTFLEFQAGEINLNEAFPGV
jgi:NAD(P)-dependent dehydrogenase (short-subunit alcohol dehydrogenase family)